MKTSLFLHPLKVKKNISKMHTIFATVAKILVSCMHCTVVGIINHFIFKVMIFWEKVKVSLALEN
jgi:hypothetical protein